MKLNKEKFLKTEVGAELDSCIKAWDDALEGRRKVTPGLSGGNEEGFSYEYWDSTCKWCQAQWEVYKMVLNQFYGVDYHFTRTDEYFGVCTEDGTDFLIKYDRKDM